MRLTLRTLLAYLDDRLSPANARELGQKISASPFARELAERIKGVVRKRRLATSEPGQKSIDANLIAEYLDDQLTPELVALIEKEILGSDQSLAEVAATHQILGLLADPLDINDNLKTRLYQMDPVAEAKAGGAMTEAEISASKEWKPLAPVPAASRRSPMLVLALMVFGWLALLFLDHNLYRDGSDQVLVVNPPQKENPPAAAAAAAANANANANANAADDRTNGAAENSDAQLVKDGPLKVTAPVEKTASDLAIEKAQSLTMTPGSNDVLNPPGGVAPATDQQSDASSESQATATADSATATADSAGDSTQGGAASLTTAAANVAMVDAANATSDVQKKVPDVEAKPDNLNRSLFAEDPSGMLIVSSPQTTNTAVDAEAGPGESPNPHASEYYGWLWASDLDNQGGWNETLSDRLVCLAAPFVSTIGCQSAGWQVKVVGSSLLQGISGETAGLKVFSGRLILSRQVAADSVPFVLQVGGRQLQLHPTDTMQRLAIEVLPAALASPGGSRQQKSLIDDTAAVLVKLAAFGGPCDISEMGSDEPVSLPDGSHLEWTSGAQLSGDVIRQEDLSWDWVAEAQGQVTAGQAALHQTLASHLKSHRSVMDAVASVAEDANPVIAEWAVQIPIAQHNVDVLVGLMFQSDQQVVRAAAFYALQDLVRTAASGRQAVESLLGTRLDLSEMEQAMRMVAEISRISLEDRLTSEWLVDMLNSDRLVLREMAISTLTEHLGRNNNYYADEEKHRRDRAVRRWKSEIDRNGGRLIPPQE